MSWASIPPMRTEDGRIEGSSEFRSQTCPNLAMHVNDHLSQSSIRLVEALESFSCPVQDMFFGLLDSDDSDSISMQACRVLVCILGGRVFGRQSVGVGACMKDETDWKIRMPLGLCNVRSSSMAAPD